MKRILVLLWLAFVLVGCASVSGLEKTDAQANNSVQIDDLNGVVVDEETRQASLTLSGTVRHDSGEGYVFIFTPEDVDDASTWELPIKVELGESLTVYWEDVAIPLEYIYRRNFIRVYTEFVPKDEAVRVSYILGLEVLPSWVDFRIGVENDYIYSIKIISSGRELRVIREEILD